MDESRMPSRLHVSIYDTTTSSTFPQGWMMSRPIYEDISVYEQSAAGVWADDWRKGYTWQCWYCGSVNRHIIEWWCPHCGAPRREQ